jgi:hypothetical protein
MYIRPAHFDLLCADRLTQPTASQAVKSLAHRPSEANIVNHILSIVTLQVLQSLQPGYGTVAYTSLNYYFTTTFTQHHGFSLQIFPLETLVPKGDARDKAAWALWAELKAETLLPSS